ncbi:hypothetical protein ISCGN_027461 [Ixodes scapularis]
MCCFQERAGREAAAPVSCDRAEQEETRTEHARHRDPTFDKAPPCSPHLVDASGARAARGCLPGFAPFSRIASPLSFSSRSLSSSAHAQSAPLPVSSRPERRPKTRRRKPRGRAPAAFSLDASSAGPPHQPPSNKPFFVPTWEDRKLELTQGEKHCPLIFKLKRRQSSCASV